MASSVWPIGSELRYGSAMLDVAGGNGMRFAGASQPVMSGETAEQWVQSYTASAFAGGCSAAGDVAIRVDGIPATTILGGCVDPTGQTGIGHGRRFDIVVVDAGRGYDFRLDGDVGESDLEAIAATIDLHPSDARAFRPARDDFSVICDGTPCMGIHIFQVLVSEGPGSHDVLIGVRLSYAADGPGARIDQADWRITPLDGRPSYATLGPHRGDPPASGRQITQGPLLQGLTSQGTLVLHARKLPARLSFDPKDSSRVSRVGGTTEVWHMDLGVD